MTNYSTEECESTREHKEQGFRQTGLRLSNSDRASNSFKLVLMQTQQKYINYYLLVNHYLDA